MKNFNFNVRELCRGAIIAALYTALTFLIQPIASGLLQCRLTEALTVLPFYSVSAIPGLFIGCLLFNLLSGALLPDIIFGSLATLLAAISTWLIRHYVKNHALARALAPAPSVILNGLIVGAVLVYAYDVGVSYPIAALYVAVGQAIACYAIGYPLMFLLDKLETKLFQ